MMRRSASLRSSATSESIFSSCACRSSSAAASSKVNRCSGQVIEIQIPGGNTLRLAHGVLDFNGTLACDGRLRDGVAERLRLLASTIDLHVVTGDTMGTAREALRELPLSVHVLAPER